jgi:septum site-determining protein MinC
VTVRDASDPAAVANSLQQQLERKAGGFFAGAPVTLELPAGVMDLELAQELGALLVASGMRLVRVEVPEAEGEDGVANGADRAASAKQGQAGDGSGAGQAVPEGAALVVRRTLRSGQRVVHDGPVLVLGDVNPGAEVVAGGSVVVWGRLRGMVEAGRLFEESVVCALDLAPTQLRIGAAIARAPEEPGRVPVPEVAREGANGIVVDAWR